MWEAGTKSAHREYRINPRLSSVPVPEGYCRHVQRRRLRQLFLFDHMFLYIRRAMPWQADIWAWFYMHIFHSLDIWVRSTTSRRNGSSRPWPRLTYLCTGQHISNCLRLYNDIKSGNLDDRWIGEVESQDNIFPDIDYEVYSTRDVEYSMFKPAWT